MEDTMPLDNYETVLMDEDLPLKIIYLNQEVMEETLGYRLQIGVEYYIPPHWHRSVELSYVLNGSLSLRINDQLSMKHAGDVFLINSGQVHEVASVLEDDEFEMIVLLISYDYLNQVFKNFNQVEFLVNERVDKQHLLPPKMSEIANLYGDGSNYDSFLIKAKLYEILSILNSEFKEVNLEVAKDYALAKEVITYINNNYDENLSQSETADRFHLSREYFSRLFKKSFGFTFTQYLINYRLYKAFPDIVFGKEPIIEIAAIHGFPDSRSLIRHFKEKYKVTPGEFRKGYSGSLKRIEQHNFNNSISIEPRK